MNKESDCIFCKIAHKEIPVVLEYEDEILAAFNDKEPRAPLHVLIIPKNHIARISDLTEQTSELVGRMVIAANKIAEKRGAIDAGYRLVMNCGENGGQAIGHLHMHLLAGRQLGWPPG